MRDRGHQQDRFYELLEPELPRLQAFCRKLVADAERGDDLMQDALYDAWRGFGRLRDTAAFKSWLYRIVINRYRTDLRRIKKRAGQTVSLDENIADERQSRLRVARDRLNLAMARLSAKDRALVTLHELEGWSYAELAMIYGKSAGALRTRLTRCRRLMRETLQKYLETADENSSLIGVSEQCVALKQERN
jgi:RNA polymerase sigma-70 factor (ECF subfamily)